MLSIAGRISDDIYYMSSMSAASSNPTVIRRMDFQAEDIWINEFSV